MVAKCLIIACHLENLAMMCKIVKYKPCIIQFLLRVIFHTPTKRQKNSKASFNAVETYVIIKSHSYNKRQTRHFQKSNQHIGSRWFCQP